MHRGPLWQFFLALFFVAFVVERAALAVFASGASGHAWLILAHALEATGGAIVAYGIWRGRRWTLGPLLALAALVALIAATQAFVLGTLPIAAAVGRIALVTLLAGGLSLLLRYEFREGETNEERARRARNDPSDRRSDGATDA